VDIRIFILSVIALINCVTVLICVLILSTIQAKVSQTQITLRMFLDVANELRYQVDEFRRLTEPDAFKKER
jgi:hypothetical protein